MQNDAPAGTVNAFFMTTAGLPGANCLVFLFWPDVNITPVHGVFQAFSASRQAAPLLFHDCLEFSFSLLLGGCSGVYKSSGKGPALSSSVVSEVIASLIVAEIIRVMKRM